MSTSNATALGMKRNEMNASPAADGKEQARPLSRSRRHHGSSRFSWLVPTIYILLLMVPIYWLVNMSFKTNAEIVSSMTLFPHNPTLDNYRTIFTDSSWYSGYINSILYVVMNMVISVAVALPAFRTLKDGQKVEYQPAQGKKGMEATNVKPC